MKTLAIILTLAAFSVSAGSPYSTNSTYDAYRAPTTTYQSRTPASVGIINSMGSQRTTVTPGASSGFYNVQRSDGTGATISPLPGGGFSIYEH